MTERDDFSAELLDDACRAWLDDHGGGWGSACSNCGKRRPHTIRRINLTGRPTLCNPCFEEKGR